MFHRLKRPPLIGLVKIIGLAIIAVCSATALHTRVYQQFDRVRIRVVTSEVQAVDGSVVVPLPDLTSLAGMPTAIVLQAQNGSPETRTVLLVVGGTEIGRFVIRPTQSIRVDLSIPTQTQLHEGDRVALTGNGDDWAVHYLELANVHGFSSGLFSFVITPTDATLADPFSIIVSFLLFCLLLVLSIPLFGLHEGRVVRFVALMPSATVLCFLFLILALPAASSFKVLLSTQAFSLCVVALYGPATVIWIARRDVRPYLTRLVHLLLASLASVRHTFEDLTGVKLFRIFHVCSYAVLAIVRICNSVRRTVEHFTGVPISRMFHVFSFVALAVAHPLFEVISREPAFFIARNTTIYSLVAMVAVVCLGLPAVLVVIEVACTKLSATAGFVVHTAWIMALGAGFAMPILKRFEGLGAFGSMGFALLLGGAVALAYRRFDIVRTFATALSPAVAIVPMALLLNPNVTQAVVRTDAFFSPAVVVQAPPIVLVVFDEFPVASLLDRNHQIDRERYPNFARLADTATWYRNATTVSSQTVWAVPAIASGRYPVEIGAVPTRRYYPNNLFTMLSGSYDMTVFGRFLQLCPPNTCTYDLEVHDDLGALVSDLSMVYAHVITPDALADKLPPILGDWRDFARARTRRDEEGRRRRNERASEQDRFLEAITGEREGRLYFLHNLTPHMPFEYVPSGHRYDAPDYQGHEEGGERLFLKSDPWLPRVLQQRHLLQVGFVDRFVGKLLDRLKTQGIFDETLIIITADHGTSFQHGLPRRSARDGTREDVMFVPFLMKLPAQINGRVSDLNVETVDIVPTIASALSTTVPYAVDGHSILDSVGALDRAKTFIRRGGDRVNIEEYEELAQGQYVSLEQRLVDFPLGLYALGPHQSLVGLPLSVVETHSADETLIRLDDPQSFTSVDVESHTLPLYVHGTMLEESDERVSLAIAVNGVIAATTQSYLEHDVWAFASMVPEELLVSGANDVKVFVIGVTQGEPILTLAAQASP